MDDQKIENLLNLALDVSPGEREKSESLEVGYDPEENTWEVIVRYSGSLLEAAPLSWRVTELSGGYAIVTLPQGDVDVLAALPQVEYVEKPKRLYFSLEAGRQASCVSALQSGAFALKGQGVLVAVIDSGVDYFHPDFRREDGTSRILALWDQTWAEPFGAGRSPDAGNGQRMPEGRAGAGPLGRIPDGFSLGREYTKAEIDAALAAGSRGAGLSLVPEEDSQGHGTAVLGIAAGNGRSSGGRYRGMAPESDLLVVKLGVPSPLGFPRTTELMMAIEYVVRRAEEFALPVAVNMSFGNVYGSHRGTSLLETYLDRMANRWRSSFVVGTGNEGSSGGHVAGRFPGAASAVPSGGGRFPGAAPAVPSGGGRFPGMDAPQSGAAPALRVAPGRGTEVVEFTIGMLEPSLAIQLWKNYADELSVTLLDPTGRSVALPDAPGAFRYTLGNTTLLAYYGEPSPYQLRQEIFLDFLPVGAYLDSGVWRILLTPGHIVDGGFDLWMSDARARGEDTRFLRPVPDTTMTIPSTASRVIAVGAYDARRNAYAPYSGRGWPEALWNVRPDLAAPGTEITAPAPGGGYAAVTGTSFATPFVTGAAALLMQWGILEGNDPYLYGEKVRAYLQRGARPLPGFDSFPNNQVGYGALCVRDSLPV